MKSKGLFEIVTGAIPKPEEGRSEWEKRDAKAQEIIVTRIEEKPLTHILACDTSAQMWDKLMCIYEQKSQVSVHLMLQKFFGLDYGQGGIAEYLKAGGNPKQLKEARGGS